MQKENINLALRKKNSTINDAKCDALKAFRYLWIYSAGSSYRMIYFLISSLQPIIPFVGRQERRDEVCILNVRKRTFGSFIPSIFLFLFFFCACIFSSIEFFSLWFFFHFYYFYYYMYYILICIDILMKGNSLSKIFTFVAMWNFFYLWRKKLFFFAFEKF